MNKEQRSEGGERDDERVTADQESFGTWLRRQREGREIDLREIADASKISLAYLRAFEENRFDILPAPFFAKGFLRQYARYVGLDPEEVVNFYLVARYPEGEEEKPVEAPVDERPSGSKLLIAAAIIVALLLLAVWLYASMRGKEPETDAVGPRSTGASAAEPPAAASPAATPPVTTPPAATSSGADAPGAAPPGAASPEPRQASAPSAAGRDTEKPPLLVTLDFRNDCWVETSVDGGRRTSSLKVQGESLILDAERVVEFKVGDADAVDVEVNGVPYELPSREGSSVRRVRIDLATANALAAATDGA